MPEYSSQSSNLLKKVLWLIKLRWFAIGGVFCTVYLLPSFFNKHLSTGPLYAISSFLFFYNMISFLLFRRLQHKKMDSRYLNWIANVQIAVDLLSLALLIHFSGGIENPFRFYFIFHIIIASILLSRRASFLQATFAAILFLAMGVLEYYGLIGHYCLISFLHSDLHRDIFYFGGIYFVFISTLYIAVYIAGTVSKELRERDIMLEESNSRLREKDRMKSEYVLRVSHDIKSHIAAIQSCVGPVTAGITGDLNEKQMDLLKRADLRARKLMAFVKALLDITKIRLSRDLKMKYFSLPEMISDAVALIMPRASGKAITVNLSQDPAVAAIKGRREYLQESICNILYNSVKYTPPGGNIDIALKADHGYAYIIIRDSGIGIAKDDIDKVFEEFYRASNAKEVERDGTGLGLAIAKQIIQRHNGVITIDSELGKGTTVNIKLPR